MAQVSIERQSDGSFAVEVGERDAGTVHVVTVPKGVAARLGCDHVPPEDLVRAAFEFLLEREPPTSILRRFSISDITGYFPEFPREIRMRLGAGADGG